MAKTKTQTGRKHPATKTWRRVGHLGTSMASSGMDPISGRGTVDEDRFWRQNPTISQEQRQMKLDCLFQIKKEKKNQKVIFKGKTSWQQHQLFFAIRGRRISLQLLK